MSWATTSSSFTPEATRASASANTSAMGRETWPPRRDGMMQKLHLWSQPSEIFR